MGVAAAGNGATVNNLKFKTLPSAQGWSYANDSCCQPPESSVFSVNEQVLTQDTRGNTDSAHYELPDVVNSTGNITFQVRARVLDEVLQGPGPNSFGFGFMAQTSSEIVGIGIGTHRIEGANGGAESTTAIDNTVFHDYLLKVTPGVSFQLYVDGVLALSGLPRAYSGAPNRVLFGDLTNGAGALAEVTAFHYNQANGH